VQKAQHDGVEALDDDERSELLRNPIALSELHLDAYSAPGRPMNPAGTPGPATVRVRAPALQHTETS
jgi:hypothetical protein